VNGGWILRLFYGLRQSNSHNVTDIRLPSLVVPVQANNEVTNQSKLCHTVFLMASVPSRSKMYETSAASEIHAAVHFVRKAQCTAYTLKKK